MFLICRETVKDHLDREILFAKGKEYPFIIVNNRFTMTNGYKGYFVRDDTFCKRWASSDFIEEYFEENIKEIEKGK